MDLIQRFRSAELNCQIECVVVEGLPWFRGKDVATALGYTNTPQAIQTNVEPEDKHETRQYKLDSKKRFENHDKQHRRRERRDRMCFRARHRGPDDPGTQIV